MNSHEMPRPDSLGKRHALFRRPLNRQWVVRRNLFLSPVRDLRKFASSQCHILTCTPLCHRGENGTWHRIFKVQKRVSIHPWVKL